MPTPTDAYFETQVLTATPQRLRLMLIEAALRQARLARDLTGSGNDAAPAITRCRELVAELIAGIQPDQSPLARRVLGLYTFLYSALVEAQFGSDHGRLGDVIRVLDEERVTWQSVCQQVADRPATPGGNGPSEELAPRRVQGPWAAAAGGLNAAASTEPAAFSMDA